MHDIGRTQAEQYESGTQELQPEHFEYHETELHEGGYETGLHEGQFHEAGLHESEAYENEFGQGENEQQEQMELELASELLEITNEQELDRFLGRMIRRVAKAAGTFVRSPVGQALGGILKNAARKALPIVGTALGTAIAGPAGGMIGGKLAPMAGRLFGLELEGLSGEDREFEIARRYVRFANSAIRRAARSSPSVNPYNAARMAVAHAARHHAPGFVVSQSTSPSEQPSDYAGQSFTDGRVRSRGLWIRRGRNILILGVHR